MDRSRARQILGVSTNASAEDIRKAYKRKALETHPDKTANGDDTLFKEVAAAYAVLSGQTSHMEGLEGIAATMFTPEFLAQVIQSILTVMRTKEEHTSGSTSSQQSQSMDKKHHRRPKTIHVDIKVTIEDLYKARVKKLAVKVRRPTVPGGESTHTVYISLLNYQPLYKFKGVGDENVEGGRGNIVVHVDIEPEPNIHIDDIICKHDLNVAHSINLKQYYTATGIPIKLWEDVEITVPYNPKSKCSVVEGKGMPWYDESTETEKRGSLYVYWDLQLPENTPPSNILDYFE